jgi:hypothetical protein
MLLRTIAALMMLAFIAPAEAKKAPKPAEPGFTAIMAELSGMGDMIAENKITVRVFNDEKARAAIKLILEIVGSPGEPKDTVNHVIVMGDERQSLIMVFEGEKVLFSKADKPELAKAFFAEWARRNV